MRGKILDKLTLSSAGEFNAFISKLLAFHWISHTIRTEHVYTRAASSVLHIESISALELVCIVATVVIVTISWPTISIWKNILRYVLWPGYKKVTKRLVTSLCWWLYYGDWFQMLVAESLCWRLFSLCRWFCQCIKSVTNILNRSPTSQTCHQDIWSPTSVTNIDVTYGP